jgi:hypothetical protein
MSNRLIAGAADPGPAIEAIDDAALDRIIAAVDLPLVTDRESLRSDLIAAFRSYYILRDFTRGAATRGIEQLLKVRKTVGKLIELLRKDDADNRHIRSLWAPIAKGGSPHILPQMEMLAELLDQVKLETIDYSGSPSENLTGVLLPAVYAYSFGKKAGASSKPDRAEAYGPFIRFAMAVCALDPEIPCKSPNTVWDNLKCRDRRKGAKFLKK